MGFFESKEKAQPQPQQVEEEEKSKAEKPKPVQPTRASDPTKKKPTRDKYTFFSFDYGIDIGKNYVLPKNVRLLMRCISDKNIQCTITDEDKFKILETCFKDVNNDDYMNDLPNFCVYDGNKKYNIVPDIIFLNNDSKLNEHQQSNDKRAFPLFSGICDMPFDLILDISSKCTGNKSEHMVPVGNLFGNTNVYLTEYTDYVNEKKKYINTKSNLAFQDYLINSLFTGVPYPMNGKFLSFNPEKNDYFDQDTLRGLIGRTCHIIDPKIELIQIYDKDRVKRYNNLSIIDSVRYNDIPDNFDEKDKINDIITDIEKFYMDYGLGMYLSDVISFLCQRYPDKEITLVLSTCHTLHINLESQYSNLYGTIFKAWETHLRGQERRGLSVSTYIAEKRKEEQGNIKAKSVSGGNNHNYHKYLKYKIKYEHALMSKY